MTRKSRNNGFSLIEAAIVLAVVGGVIGAIWVAAGTLTQKRRAEQTIDGAFIIADGVRRAFDKLPIDTKLRITKEQISAMGLIPYGWQLGKTFGASSNIDSPLFPFEVFISSDVITLQGNTVIKGNKKGCVAFGIMLFQRMVATKNISYAHLYGNVKDVSVEYIGGEYYVAHADNSDTEGAPDPLLLVNELGGDCIWTDIVFFR